jgi:hypothetical protein
LGNEVAIYDINNIINYTVLSSMTEWTGGFPVYLAKWYDQTGLGRDLIQNDNSLQPIVLLFTSDGFPAIMMLIGSNIQANLNLPIQDFTLLMNAGFAPTSSSNLQMVQIFETNNISTFDSLNINNSGIFTAADSILRSISQSTQTYNFHSIGWAMSDTY